ncbi:MAG: hypothetical protein M3Z04_22235 [Chloroflexota bacterium]|nr:hypothetical protein [Chloroflexota bacterium]
MTRRRLVLACVVALAGAWAIWPVPQRHDPVVGADGNIYQAEVYPVPLYPNAQAVHTTARPLAQATLTQPLLRYNTDAFKGSLDQATLFVTNAPAEAVQDYYRRLMPPYGWRPYHPQRAWVSGFTYGYHAPDYPSTYLNLEVRTSAGPSGQTNVEIDFFGSDTDHTDWQTYWTAPHTPVPTP